MHIGHVRSGSEVIKPFSCSAQLSMKFILIINLKLVIIANSLLLNTVEQENFSAHTYENTNYNWAFSYLSIENFMLS